MESKPGLKVDKTSGSAIDSLDNSKDGYKSPIKKMDKEVEGAIPAGAYF